MNQVAFLRYAFEEATAAADGERRVLVDLRCNLPRSTCGNAKVATVYATRVGFLLVAKVSVKATAALAPDRTGMAIATGEHVPRYWLLTPSGPTALAHPSPLTQGSTPSLLPAGARPIRVLCSKHRQWIACSDELVLDSATKAQRSPGRSVLMVPC